jgi:hypothetical protein
MNKVLQCRRSILGLFSVICLTFLGYHKDMDVSVAIAGVVASVAASNSYEKSKKTHQ